MIDVYRSERSADADAAVAVLRELVVGHRVHVLPDGDTGPAGALPTITEGRRIVGPDGIDAYLAELKAYMSDARLFQTDSCYIDSDGQMC